ncbi:GAT1A [Hepatospora eriocheir]|uniref:GAT1A n=1 Tax=Hepatospora eriocheir TaxID=1081669 RepID=A0A1X0QKY5_9MICR|nr:GAT1A [Hepatospora eriocheir]
MEKESKFRKTEYFYNKDSKWDRYQYAKNLIKNNHQLTSNKIPYDDVSIYNNYYSTHITSYQNGRSYPDRSFKFDSNGFSNYDNMEYEKIPYSDYVRSIKMFDRNNTDMRNIDGYYERRRISIKRRCSNCETTVTPTWRRSLDKNSILCNACGLYLKMHKKNRQVIKQHDGSLKILKTSSQECDLIKCEACDRSLDRSFYSNIEYTKSHICNNCMEYYRSEVNDIAESVNLESK